MSIEMDNPQTLLELIDAAASHVATIRLSMMIGDRQGQEQAIEKAAELLFQALLKAEELE